MPSRLVICYPSATERQCYANDPFSALLPPPALGWSVLQLNLLGLPVTLDGMGLDKPQSETLSVDWFNKEKIAI